MLSFDEARAIVASSQGWDPAPWGWENDEVFVMEYEHSDDRVPVDEPDLLIDKRTGELRWVENLADEPAAQNLRPVSVKTGARYWD